VLRRQLLRLIHCKEFGPEAAYKDPCMTLILPDVICATCQDCQDLDLCRDPQVRKILHQHYKLLSLVALLATYCFFSTASSQIQQRDWRCKECGVERDVGAIEAQVTCMLCSVADGYQVQDLKCCKCGTVATNHLQRQCDVCGGHLKATVEGEKNRALVNVYRNIAEYQGMETLLELANWQLQQ
jgi:DNA polymerase epsilon subunit 1